MTGIVLLTGCLLAGVTVGIALIVALPDKHRTRRNKRGTSVPSFSWRFCWWLRWVVWRYSEGWRYE